MRGPICHVWALTNIDSVQVRYAAHGLNTGFVPLSGETNYASIDLLSIAIKKNRFGPIPKIANGFPFSHEEFGEWGARDFTPNELSELRKQGIKVK